MASGSLRELVTARLRSIWRTSLYANAFYLMLGSVASGLSGFAFWILVTRLYTPSEIGFASALISITTLLAASSTLGLGYGIIRFLSSFPGDSSRFLNSCLTTAGLTSVLVSVVFLLGLPLWSPALFPIRGSLAYSLTFVAIALAFTLFALVENALIAHRRSGFILSRNLLWGLLRLALLLLLLSLISPSLSIFAAWGLALGITLMVSLFLFLPRAQPGYKPRPCLDRGAIRRSLSFSFTNYLAEVAYGAPPLLLPLVIINTLGREPAAFFALALTIGNFLAIASASASRSLFAEASYQEDQLGQHAWQSLKFIAILLLPAVLLVVVASPYLLSLLYGSAYAQGATTLTRLLVLNAIPSAVVSVYLSVQRVRRNLIMVMTVTLFIGAVSLGLSLLLLPRMGIAGAGVAFLTAEGGIALMVAVSLLRRRLRGQRGAESRDYFSD